jgi:hypothetical protein
MRVYGKRGLSPFRPLVIGGGVHHSLTIGSTLRDVIG